MPAVRWRKYSKAITTTLSDSEIIGYGNVYAEIQNQKKKMFCKQNETQTWREPAYILFYSFQYVFFLVFIFSSFHKYAVQNEYLKIAAMFSFFFYFFFLSFVFALYWSRLQWFYRYIVSSIFCFASLFYFGNSFRNNPCAFFIHIRDIHAQVS